MNFKKIMLIMLLVIIVIGVVAFVGSGMNKSEKSDKLNIVVTSFSAYDFVRAIAGDNVELTFLLGARKRCS